jgi:hypothetical protein
VALTVLIPRVNLLTAIIGVFSLQPAAYIAGFIIKDKSSGEKIIKGESD